MKFIEEINWYLLRKWKINILFYEKYKTRSRKLLWTLFLFDIFIQTHIKIKLPVFGRAAFSYSAVQTPFDIVLPLVIGLHKETNVRVSLGKQLNSRFCVQPTYGAQEYLTWTDTALSGYQITPWSSGASEIHSLCPEKFKLGTYVLTDDRYSHKI